MADIQKIINILSDYKGDMDSLNEFVSVAESEYGENWVLDIQKDAAELPDAIKGRFDHAYNYYSATVAWNEIQSYLEADYLDLAEMQERIPVLEYWLKFFGKSGKDIVNQLRQKVQALQDGETLGVQQVEAVPAEMPVDDTPADEEADAVAEDAPETPSSAVEEARAAAEAEALQEVSEPVGNEEEQPIDEPEMPETSEENQAVDETMNAAETVVESAPAGDDERAEAIRSTIDNAFPSEDVLDTPVEREEQSEEDRISAPVTESIETPSVESATETVSELAVEPELVQEPETESSINEADIEAEKTAPESPELPTEALDSTESVDSLDESENGTMPMIADPEPVAAEAEQAGVDIMESNAEMPNMPDVPVASIDEEQEAVVEPILEPAMSPNESDTSDVESSVVEPDSLDVESDAGVEPVMESVPVESVEPSIPEMPETITFEPSEIPAETIVETAESVEVESVSQPKIVGAKFVQSSAPRDPALFMVEKIDRQLDLLQQVQAWISARCVALGDIEPYKYTYYGFLMDMEQQVLNDVDTVLADKQTVALLQEKYAGRLKKMQDTALVLKTDLEASKGLYESNPTPLINQDMSADAAREALGGLDTSAATEYLGPAPDGFEMLEDPYETENGELDEARLKSDYEKIEDGVSVQTAPIVEREKTISQSNAPESEKELANSPQKGVERKISVSLGMKPMRKKPSVGTTDTE